MRTLGGLGLAGVAGAQARDPRSEAIAGLELFTVMVGPRAWLVFRLRTSGGQTGLGDATHSSADPVVCANAARALLETVKGSSVFEIERLREAALPMVAAAGGGRDHRPIACAFAGLEQCMWDLQGKILGLPVSELFGGRLRSEVRNYANINRATRGDQRNPEGFAANAKRAVAAGFDAFKLAPFDGIKRDPEGGAEYRRGVDLGVRSIAAVREAIGDNRDLLIDGHGRFSREQAIETAARLEGMRLYWFEESVPGIENLAAVNRAAPMPTAGGESLFGVEAFYPYIAGKAVDIVMPDIKFCGGLLELKKIAAMAEGAEMACAPHGPASPVGNMAAAQVCATLPNFSILEFAHGEVDWRADTVTPEEPIQNGRLTVLDRPGIGYELNEKRWKRYV